MPKVYIQTETHDPTAAHPEVRGRQFVMEAACSTEKVAQMLGAVSQHLGAIAAVPPTAHEANLKSILPRDLAAHDIPTGPGEEGTVTLKVLRTPGTTGPAGQADVIALAYKVVVE